MSATLADVAERAGVSVATASRVLNGSTRSVNAELRSRVLDAAANLRYVPNAHAQALVRERSATVGVIVHDVSDPYFAEIMRGIQPVASATRRLVTICNSYREPERELEYARLLLAQRVEALIMAGSGLDDRAYSQAMTGIIESFTAFGGTVAFVGRHAIPGSAVIPDNPGGSRAAARLLADLGHRYIGVISGPDLLTSTHDRMSGFRRGLQEKGLDLPPDWVVPSDFSREGGVNSTHELLRRHPNMTAIFALNDVMAIGAMAALRQLNMQVPEHMSIIGFDDIPSALDVTPALTTVHVSMVELGERALRLALASPATPYQVEYMPTELIIRGSTACPRCNATSPQSHQTAELETNRS